MLAPGNLRQIYEALRDRWQVGDAAGDGEVNPLAAQIVRGVVPAWYVLQIAPAHERIAAQRLAERRFGVFLPECAHVAFKHGRRTSALKPMFPGYVFIFAWLDGGNHHRALLCPGVLDFLRRVDLAPAVIPDALIDAVRAEENKQQPVTVDREGYHMVRPRKRGFRRYRKIVQDSHAIEDNQIIGVHTWSALRDGVRQLDDTERNRLLLDALGVA